MLRKSSLSPSEPEDVGANARFVKIEFFLFFLAGFTLLILFTFLFSRFLESKLRIEDSLNNCLIIFYF